MVDIIAIESHTPLIDLILSNVNFIVKIQTQSALFWTILGLIHLEGWKPWDILLFIVDLLVLLNGLFMSEIVEDPNDEELDNKVCWEELQLADVVAPLPGKVLLRTAECLGL